MFDDSDCESSGCPKTNDSDDDEDDECKENEFKFRLRPLKKKVMPPRPNKQSCTQVSNFFKVKMGSWLNFKSF